MNHVIAEVVDRHVEEAAILWYRRDFATEEPHFSLDDLARLDDQVAAHLDGIAVAEHDSPGAGWSVCERELRWKAPGEVFAAAILACECHDPRRLAEVRRAAAHCYDCSRALISALGWLSEELASPAINQFISSQDPFDQRIGIASLALHGRDPGESLENALARGDEWLAARALRAIGELARHDLVPSAQKALTSPHPRVRFSAAWSLARLTTNETALMVLRETVAATPNESQIHSPQASDQQRALQLVLRRMSLGEAAQWLNQLSQNPELLGLAVVGAGVVGLPESIPWLLQLMQSPPLARVAGEAFTMITGLDLAAQKLDAPWPAGFTAGPTEDPDDDNVAMDPDENLPWPDVTKLAAWWRKHSPEFQPATRYLCGQPLTEDWLEHILRHGYQRQRAAAALELALLRPDQFLFNTRAPGHRQQELLGLR